jgi:hypothetical protein
LPEQELGLLHDGLSNQENDDVVGMASKLLSETSHMAGVVTLPRKDLVCLRHIEFLPLHAQLQGYDQNIMKSDNWPLAVILQQKTFSPYE